jgi:hypothetical protein
MPAHDLLCRRLRVAVFFIVRPIAVAVLEVDPEVLDRFPPQLLHDSSSDDIGEVVRAIEFEDARESRAIRRVLVERRERHGTKPGCGIRAKEMRSPIDCVHRLAIAGLARPRACHGFVRRTELFEDGLKISWRERTC